MVIIAAPTAVPIRPTPSAAGTRGRDGGIDLVRALCVVAVVVLHALMVGVSVTGGTAVFDDASAGTWWVVPMSWALQVMPLFFVIGGFSGHRAHTAARLRGGGDAAFVSARVQRLLRPAVVVIGAVGAALLLLPLAGVPADLVAVAGYRYGQPLWFLAVFLLCQALLPWMISLHRRRPVVILLALVSTAVLVDVARDATGITALGFLNLAFVWLALQQVGFFLADGRIDALSRRLRIGAGIGAVVLLLGSFASGFHSPDLIANINPPTTALLLVGAAQTAALSLKRDALERASRRPGVAALTAFITPRTMTIYLWHMPVLLAMAGVTALAALVGGLPLPAVGGPEWGAQRPLWLAVAVTLTALLAVPLSRVEARRGAAPSDSPRRTTLAVLSGLCGVVLLLVVGTGAVSALVSLLLLGGALLLARGPHRSAAPAQGRSDASVVSAA